MHNNKFIYYFLFDKTVFIYSFITIEYLFI